MLLLSLILSVGAVIAMLMVLGLIGISGPDWLWLLVAGSLAGAIAGMPYGLRYRSRIALAAITGAVIVWGLGFWLDPTRLLKLLGITKISTAPHNTLPGPLSSGSQKQIPRLPSPPNLRKPRRLPVGRQ